MRALSFMVNTIQLQVFRDSPYGSDRTIEAFLRTCFLRIFLDPLNFDSDKANWLNVFYEHAAVN